MSPSRPHDPIRLFLNICGDLGSKFVRQRIWGPHAVLVCLFLLKGARSRGNYRRLLRGMSEQVMALFSWRSRPSIASFSQARDKLGIDVCRSILRQVSERISACAPQRFQHPSGRRLVGIDGTHIVVPRTRSTLHSFPRPSNQWLRTHYPQALAVMAVDLIKRLPLEWVLLAKGTAERAGAQVLSAVLKVGDVVIMDRGFPARWLLKEFLARQIDVVMRMTTSKANGWPEVQSFLASRQDEAVVEVRIDAKRTIPMRLIRRAFRTGRPKKHQKAETMVVLTTLMDAQQFPREEILRLYSARWGVETMFREIKVDLDLERFHSRSLVGIEQELATALIWIALTSAIQHLAENELPEGRMVYRTDCSHVAEMAVNAALLGNDPWATIEKFLPDVQRYHHLPRTGRSEPRHSKSPFGRFENDPAK